METTTKKFTVPVTISVTGQQIDDILTDALEGGITYWCDGAEVKGMDFCGADYASDVISRGGALWLRYNDGDDKRVMLTLDKFLKGLALMIQEQGFNFEDYDANDVDMVVQYAVFGEVVYG